MSNAADSAAPAGDGNYVVVARRYRPQTFEQLVGQEHVGRALAGAISSNRVGHAYLFTGARGVGKTSAARILAKALNCEQGPTPTPCNVCDTCRSISAGDDVDVLEIDGASNRNIDDIRELRQNVAIRPSRSRYKIYIIDEVHQLSKDAFNALLKTLEEPPEHVKFIFCTTEPEKIPITILSRCQRFDFAGIQTLSIVERLRQIVVAEQVEADTEALEVLARRAAGSMRDSQSLLEQLLSFGDARITVADVHRLLGTAGDERLGQIARFLVERNAGAALAELDAAIAEGVDVGRVLDQLLGYLRDLMVAAVGASDETFLYVSSADRAAAGELARQWGLETILAAMQMLDQTLSRLRYSTHGRLLAELALVRIARLDDLVELSSLIEAARSGTPLTAAPAAPARPAMKSSPPPTRGVDSKKNESEPVIAPSAQSTDAAATPSPTLSVTSGNVQEVWQRALRELSDMTAANAETCESVAISAPNRLLVTFPRRYTSCKEFCERPEHVARLNAALETVSGQPLRVEFAVSAESASEPSPAERPKPANSRERLIEKSQNPLVRRAMELFDARPVRLEETGP